MVLHAEESHNEKLHFDLMSGSNCITAAWKSEIATLKGHRRCEDASCLCYRMGNTNEFGWLPELKRKTGGFSGQTMQITRQRSMEHSVVGVMQPAHRPCSIKESGERSGSCSRQRIFSLRHILQL